MSDALHESTSIDPSTNEQSQAAAPHASPDTPAESVAPEAPALEPLDCPHCGYDVRSRSQDRCPECGTAIDADAARAQMMRLAGIRVALRSSRQFVVAVWIMAAAVAVMLSPLMQQWRATNNMSRRVAAGMVFLTLTCLYMGASRLRRVERSFGHVRKLLAAPRREAIAALLRSQWIQFGLQGALFVAAAIYSL